MAAYVYTFVDGQRTEVNVAAAFRKMAAAFKKDTGCTLRITSGTRTRAEQTSIFLKRYVTAGNVRGRKVYDTRWWGGKLWYRISSAGTVAQPGTSNHEETGPSGPRAIDIADSGSDYGVTRRGTARDKWMEKNAARFGFQNEGYAFREPWHKKFTGKIGGAAPASSGTAPLPATTKKGKNNMTNMIHWVEPNAIIKPGKAGQYTHTEGPRTHYLVFTDTLIIAEFYHDQFHNQQDRANRYAGQIGSSVLETKAEYARIRAAVIANGEKGAGDISEALAKAAFPTAEAIGEAIVKAIGDKFTK